MVETALTIRPLGSGDEKAFAALNLAWIEEHFTVEAEDRRQLENPDGEIIAQGGHIAIAEWKGEIVGTGALVPAPHPPQDGLKWGEIIKMATTPKAQGQGVGSAVLDYLIAEAVAQGMDGLWLETNDSLGAATKLYARKGFKPLERGEEWPTPYSRCNLQLTLLL